MQRPNGDPEAAQGVPAQVRRRRHCQHAKSTRTHSGPSCLGEPGMFSEFLPSRTVILVRLSWKTEGAHPQSEPARFHRITCSFSSDSLLVFKRIACSFSPDNLLVFKRIACSFSPDTVLVFSQSTHLSGLRPAITGVGASGQILI